MKKGRFQWEVLDNPPYSLDLAPTDLFLFGHLKKHQGGQHFRTDGKIQFPSVDRSYILQSRPYRSTDRMPMGIPDSKNTAELIASQTNAHASPVEIRLIVVPSAFGAITGLMAREASLHPISSVAETSRNITTRDISGEIHYLLENSRRFRTRQHGHQSHQIGCQLGRQK
ncbi:hypothetical protein TNCV_3487771 [Trichonephila clavipes]|nr:hypothetical protein TNCV_3487771 [Trichonephila clavipes]